MVAAASEYPRGAVDPARSVCPGRSAKSRDGGQSFETDTLGALHGLEGEYSVRLRVDRSAPKGRFTAAVVDLAALGGRGIEAGATVPVDGAVVEATLRVEVDLPPLTSGALLVRHGLGPSPDSGEWSEYQRLDGWEWQSASGRCWPAGLGQRGWPAGLGHSGDVPRYLQFAVELESHDPLSTPALVSADITTAVTAPTATARPLRIVELENGKVLGPSA
jgi:hypothetical protein